MPQYQESPALATIDDMSGARSEIIGAVRVLLARWRMEITEDDAAEFQRILDAADRMQQYHLEIRAIVSAAYQKERAALMSQPPARPKLD